MLRRLVADDPEALRGIPVRVRAIPTALYHTHKIEDGNPQQPVRVGDVIGDCVKWAVAGALIGDDEAVGGVRVRHVSQVTTVTVLSLDPGPSVSVGDIPKKVTWGSEANKP